MSNISFGWVQPYIFQLCKLNQGNLEFCLSNDAATAQFVAWTIRGYERLGKVYTDLERLAGVIATEKRRLVIESAWGFDPGRRIGMLKRLGKRVLGRTSYDDLTTILRNTSRKQVACNMKGRLTPKMLRLLAQEDLMVLRTIGPLRLSRVGVELANYVINSVRRLRPELNDAELVGRLRRSELDDIESLRGRLETRIGVDGRGQM
jgi:hypothetical protein